MNFISLYMAPPFRNKASREGEVLMTLRLVTVVSIEYPVSYTSVM